jgi:hypothetical protein
MYICMSVCIVYVVVGIFHIYELLFLNCFLLEFALIRERIYKVEEVCLPAESARFTSRVFVSYCF